MADNNNTDTAAQNKAAAESTLAADETAARKGIENTGHDFLRRSLAWLASEFEKAGLKIEQEIEKLIS